MGKRGSRTVSELGRMIHEHVEWLGGAVKIVRGLFEESRYRYASASPGEELPLASVIYLASGLATCELVGFPQRCIRTRLISGLR